MRLPNLLLHDSVDEVYKESGSWMNLVQRACHRFTRQFLCTLYAPICLDADAHQVIYPCRSLCQGVKDGCLPTMTIYGFDWPDMLACDKFPLDNDLCLSSAKLSAMVQTTTTTAATTSRQEVVAPTTTPTSTASMGASESLSVVRSDITSSTDWV